MSNKELTFEAAMTRLEETISKMEVGSLTLDESIEEFEKALCLIKHCESKLAVAKDRVRILTVSADGAVTDAPFEEE